MTHSKTVLYLQKSNTFCSNRANANRNINFKLTSSVQIFFHLRL